jgi:hypothetical protein
VIGDIRIQGHRNILFDYYVRTFIIVDGRWGARPPCTVGQSPFQLTDSLHVALILLMM